MKKRTILVSLVVGIFLFGGISGQDFAWALDCDGLTSLRLPRTTILSAEEVPAAGDVPKHCRVLGVIEKEIKFEALLPHPDNWNGKFLMGGGGGMVGQIQNHAQGPQYMGGLTALQRGYVTAGTDTGHEGLPPPLSSFDASAFLNNQRAKLDYAYRAVHLTAVMTKRIIKSYYGRPPEYSYFLGCSTGGRQAINSAWRFPKDFDGIVAGAPAHVFTWFIIGWIWIQQAMFPDANDLSEATVPYEKLSMLENEILDVCDLNDGLEDRLMRDPRDCNPIPVVEALACPEGTDAEDCFTPEQIEVVKRVYEGPSNSEGQIFWGFPPGGEGQPGGWPLWVAGGTDVNPWLSPRPNIQYAIGQDVWRYWMFSDPEYDIRDFEFTPDEVRKCLQIGKKFLEVGTNFNKFKRLGGKMILWSGWADYAINPRYTIWFYEQVLDRMGGRERVEDFFRLFMSPGVTHCSGGTGPAFVDWIDALEDWVEHGNPPDRIIGYNMDDENFSRPLCPYPEVAEYDGTGNIYDAGNFDCMEP